jgi:hypothetical protein
MTQTLPRPYSYPISQREPGRMAGRTGWLEAFAKRRTLPPTTLEEEQQQLERMIARWGRSPATTPVPQSTTMEPST